MTTRKSASATQHRAPRRGVVVGAACLIALATFGFRFLSLRGLPNDHYMHLAWAQQLLSGEIPGRDFVEPGLPLQVAIAAIGQLLWPGPFGDTVLSILMLAVAAAATSVVVARLSGSILTGVAAAVFQVALFPRLYCYPKVLVPALMAVLVWRYGLRPSRGRLAALAAWTVAAFLLRHDLGVVCALAVLGAILVMESRTWRWRRDAAVTFIVLGLAFVAPYLVFLQVNGGVVAHVHEALEMGKADSHQIALLDPPAFPSVSAEGAHAWTRSDGVALLYWAAHLLFVALLMLIVFRRKAPNGDRATATAVCIALGLYLLYILRHSLEARLPDLAGVLSLAAGIVVGGAVRAGTHVRARPVAAVVLGLAALALAAMAAVGTVTLRDLGSEIQDTNIQRGVRGVLARGAQVIHEGTTFPWTRYWPDGDIPEAVDYIRACTAPDDHLLVTWPAPEYFLFTQRPFAAGHAWFLVPRAFVGRHDQLIAIARLQSRAAPIALVNDARYGEFSAAVPDLAAYIDRTYDTIGAYDNYDGSRISIRARRDWGGKGRYGAEGWPCGPGRRQGGSEDPPLRSAETRSSGHGTVTTSGRRR